MRQHFEITFGEQLQVVNGVISQALELMKLHPTNEVRAEVSELDEHEIAFIRAWFHKNDYLTSITYDESGVAEILSIYSSIVMEY